MTAGIAIRGLLQMVPRFLWCLLQFHSIPGKQTKSWFGAGKPAEPYLSSAARLCVESKTAIHLHIRDRMYGLLSRGGVPPFFR